MKLILHENTTYVVRLDKGDELIASLIQFCEGEKIKAGYFSGIGLTQELILSYYTIERKQYEDHEFNEKMEITGLMGNVAAQRYETIVHCHGTFGDSRMNVIGGHVKKLVVGATCEIIFHKLKGEVERAPNLETGLNLIQ